MTKAMMHSHRVDSEGLGRGWLASGVGLEVVGLGSDQPKNVVPQMVPHKSAGPRNGGFAGGLKTGPRN